MKEITKRLGAVGATRLPGWGPRDPHCAWLETLQDMAATDVSGVFVVGFYPDSLNECLEVPSNKSWLYSGEASELNTDVLLSMMCRWDACNSGPHDVVSLGQHLLHNHNMDDGSPCRWFLCPQANSGTTAKSESWKAHLLSHAVFEYYCFNSSQSLAARVGVLLENPVCSPNRAFAGNDTMVSNELRIQGIPWEWFKAENASSLIKAEREVPPLFGCYSCYTVFQEETDYLRHVHSGVLASRWRIKRRDSRFTCSWTGCGEKFESNERLHSHIEKQHWCTLLTPFCFWHNCTSDTTKLCTSIEWLRHLFLHSFIESRVCASWQRLHINRNRIGVKCRGINFQKPSYVNKTMDKLLWHTDILHSGFRCHWIECDYTTDSAQLFVDHVVEHATSDVSDNGPFICHWVTSSMPTAATSVPDVGQPTMCKRAVSKLSALKEHLYRHTGLPKFICDQCYVGFSEFNTFREHFSWSIPDPLRSDPSAFALHDNYTDSDYQESTGSPRSPSGEHTVSRFSLLHCSRCSATFITRHRLIEHQKSRKCVALGRKEEDPAGTVLLRRRPKKPGVCTRVDGAHHLISTRPEDNPQPIQYFCCQVEGCQFQSKEYWSYKDHFKRSHSSAIEGTRYMCHLCEFRAKTSRLMTKHLRDKHGLVPSTGRKRFTYCYYPNLSGYRLL
ncbi:hypothetical protein CSKR_105115 [Clonorchis sinensis]|uniref:C2H2-type domain-containing protein n=1 Tax=Clonorchis sinensis TaxID=79923 RepID=A0A419QH88_CLOSI|nr:hypothetical protein CSKR_105115 [Clonorchis sinensis]